MTIDAGTPNPATVTEETALRYLGTPDVGKAQLTSVWPESDSTFAVMPFFSTTFLALENCGTRAVAAGATALLTLTSTTRAGGPFAVMAASLAVPAGKYTVCSRA